MDDDSINIWQSIGKGAGNIMLLYIFPCQFIMSGLTLFSALFFPNFTSYLIDAFIVLCGLFAIYGLLIWLACSNILLKKEIKIKDIFLNDFILLICPIIYTLVVIVLPVALLAHWLMPTLVFLLLSGTSILFFSSIKCVSECVFRLDKWGDSRVSPFNLLLIIVMLICLSISGLALSAIIPLPSPIIYALISGFLALFLAFIADFLKNAFNLDVMSNQVSKYLLMAYPVQRLSLSVLIVSLMACPGLVSYVAFGCLMVSSLMLAIQCLFRKYHEDTPVGRVAGYLLILLGGIGVLTGAVNLTVGLSFVVGLLAINGLQLIWGKSFYYRMDDATYWGVNIHKKMFDYYKIVRRETFKINNKECENYSFKRFRKTFVLWGQKKSCKWLGILEGMSAILLVLLSLVSGSAAFQWIAIVIAILAVSKVGILILKFFGYPRAFKPSRNTATNIDFRLTYAKLSYLESVKLESIAKGSDDLGKESDMSDSEYSMDSSDLFEDWQSLPEEMNCYTDPLGKKLIRDYSLVVATHTHC